MQPVPQIDRHGVVKVDEIEEPVCWRYRDGELVVCVLGKKEFPLRWATTRVQLAVDRDKARFGPL